MSFGNGAVNVNIVRSKLVCCDNGSVSVGCVMDGYWVEGGGGSNGAADGESEEGGVELAVDESVF